MIYNICSEAMSVAVNSKGAELWSIQSADGTEYLWQGNEKYWRGRAPVLFPCVGRLPFGTYMIDGQEYPLGIHGFAKLSEFKCAEKEPDRLVLELSDSPETLAVYPRRFVFRIEFRLEGSSLIILYNVENKDEKTMYFGIGGHPGINVPLSSGSCFEDWYLEFEEGVRPLRVEFSPSCFVSGAECPYELSGGRRIELRHELFDDDAIVLKNAGHTVTLGSSSSEKSVKLSFPQMDYIGFWHMPKTDAPYVCLEPWCSLPGFDGEKTVFENRRDYISLEPGEAYVNEWHLEIK